MQVKKIITPMCELKISGITLLTAEEVAHLPEEIRKLSWVGWWTRSPYLDDSRNSHTLAYYVDANGSIEHAEVNRQMGLRPALKLYSLESSGLNIGDKFALGSKNWTIISEERALCDEAVGSFVFNVGPLKRKGCDNNYETSTIKEDTETFASMYGLTFDVPDFRRIATNINWGFDPGNDDWDDLPSSVNIPNYVTDEGIADYLSDKYGFLVEAYTVKEV